MSWITRVLSHSRVHAQNRPTCPSSNDWCAVQAKMVPATREGSRLSVISGAAQRLVDDSQNGLVASAATAPPADGKLANVAVFIDQNSMQLVPEQKAAVERCARSALKVHQGDMRAVLGSCEVL